MGALPRPKTGVRPSSSADPSATTPAHSAEETLLHRVLEIVAASRLSVARTVNTAMVTAAWAIGREIVEHEQQGEARAA